MSRLDGFEVINIVQIRSASVCTVEKNTIKFNNSTMQELRYPPFVELLINTKAKEFAIRPCKEDSTQALKFSKPEGEQKYPIKVTCAAAVELIRRAMSWKPEEAWNIPGIFFADDHAIVYSLEAAYAPNPKGGWTAKRRHEQALEEAMTGQGVTEDSEI